MGVGRRGWRGAAVAGVVLVVLVASGLLSACSSFHGPLTYLDSVDQYPVARWGASAATNMVGVNNGIYLLPQDHLILVHIYVPPAITSLCPDAVHGAVGVWWVALDDRLPGDSTPVWQPGCVRFRTGAKGAEFDLAGNYLDGPAAGSMSRYPLSLNPEDSSISVALSSADEITIPRDGGRPTGQAAPLAPTGICTTG